MPLSFSDWKKKLLDSSGSASAPVRKLGDYVLQLFWRDGCEPTLTSLLDYSQAGLCRHYDIHAANSFPEPSGLTPR